MALRSPRGTSSDMPRVTILIAPSGFPLPGWRIDPLASSGPPLTVPLTPSSVRRPPLNRTSPFRSASRNRGSRMSNSPPVRRTVPSTDGAVAGPVRRALMAADPAGRYPPRSRPRPRRSTVPSMLASRRAAVSASGRVTDPPSVKSVRVDHGAPSVHGASVTTPRSRCRRAGPRWPMPRSRDFRSASVTTTSPVTEASSGLAALSSNESFESNDVALRASGVDKRLQDLQGHLVDVP